MTSGSPSVQPAYYIPFAPDYPFSELYVEARDADTGQFLYSSPFYVVGDGQVDANVPYSWGRTLLTTTGSELHLGQAPPHWFGQFHNQEALISIEPAMSRRAPLFLNQGSDRYPYGPLPYTLYQSGDVVTSGSLPPASEFWDWSDPTTIDLSAGGAYSLEITYDQYWVGSEAGQARVVAQFDTSGADKNPPTLLALNVYHDGETASILPPGEAPEVVLRVQDDSGLHQVSLLYETDGGWVPVGLTNVGDEYQATLPGFADGAEVALRIVAEDMAGNMLTYEAVPAFRVGLATPVPHSPPAGWVTQDPHVAFAWEPVPEATSYRIQVDRSSTFDSASLISETLESTSYTATLTTGTWHWRVLAMDGSGNESDYTLGWHFTIAEPVGQVSTGEATDRDTALVATSGGDLVTVWQRDWELYTARSTDSGATWSDAVQLTECCHEHPTLLRTTDDTLWLAYSKHGNLWYRTSDDGGLTWSDETQLTAHPSGDHNPDLTQTADGRIWVTWNSDRGSGSDLWYKTTSNHGETWAEDTEFPVESGWNTAPSMIEAANGTLWLVWFRGFGLAYTTSDDGGASWAPLDFFYPGGPIGDPMLRRTDDATLWLAYSMSRHIGGRWRSHVYYQTSSDDGNTWSDPERFTSFVGDDTQPAITPMDNGNIGLAWRSDRTGVPKIWFAIPGVRMDIDPPPYVSTVEYSPYPSPESDDIITVRAHAHDETAVDAVSLVWELDRVPQSDVPMLDDGAHDDYGPYDDWYGVQIGPFPAGTEITFQVRAVDDDGNTFTWPATPKSFTVHGPPSAEFTASPTAGAAPLTVEFTNQSTGEYDTCDWDFGDGGTSTNCNDPSYTYELAGTYTVALTVSGDADSDTLTRPDYVTVYEAVQADFAASPVSGLAPLTVAFTNLSTGDYDTCAWDFGDGGASTECNDPSHDYTSPGTYTVVLTVSGLGGTDNLTRTDYITVYEPVVADFTASPTSGVPPLTVAFTNASTGDYTDSVWDFGDGFTSTEEHPSHTYQAAGLYTVALTVTAPEGGKASVSKPEYINTVSIVAEPATTTAYIGQTFSLTLMVQSGDQPIDGAQAYLDFDPAVLGVVDLTGGSALPTELQNQYDNDAGTIGYSAGLLMGEPPSGTFTLATVTFRALAETEGITIPFVSAPPRTTLLTFDGSSILGGHSDARVTVGAGASLNGTVDLQGRPDPPDPAWSIPLTLTLRAPGGDELLYTFAPSTDESGAFSISDITPGSYDATVKGAHTLANRKAITLTPGPNIVSFGTLLEGDANGDNCVNILDFSLLRTAFGTCSGDEGFDGRVDFNEDGCINILDFSLLRTNFGLCGDIDVATAKHALTTVGTGSVTMSLAASSTTVTVGKVFTLSIKIEADDQPVDGAQAHLDFDPEYLTVVNTDGTDADTITPVTVPFDSVLQNKVDNAAGTIDYAAGALTGDPPTGTFTIGCIRLRAITETQGTDVTFVFSNPRSTDASFEGASVLGESVDGHVIVTPDRKVYLPLVLSGRSSSSGVQERVDGWMRGHLVTHTLHTITDRQLLTFLR